MHPRTVMLSSRLVIAGLVGAVVLGAGLGPLERTAGACSCRTPEASLLAPDRVDDAPLSSRIRLEMPAASSGAPGPVRPLLRAHRGAEIATTSKTIAPGGWLAVVELTPKTPLAPSTQYEVAILDASSVPSTTVIGTFHTGAADDATAPRLEAVGSAVAFKTSHANSAACQVAGPWVTIEGVRAEDPGRPDAQLIFGVWLADAAGAIDTRKAPTSMVTTTEGVLRVGQSSLCDPRGFPLPKASSVQLGLAAIDESGNVSAVRRVRVDLAGARLR